MPQGGRREGAGRKPGVPNKSKGELRDLAQVYTAEALDTLAQIMRAGQSEQARVAASNALLDRGYGKPAQTLHATHTIEAPEEMTEAELAHIAARGRPGAVDPPSSSKVPGKLH